MDLEKLDDIVNELESNSKKLKDFATIYSEISSLQLNINSNLDLIKENNKVLNSISKTIKLSIEDSSKKQKSTNSFLEKRVEELYKDNKLFQKELDATLISRLDKHKSDIQVENRNETSQIQRSFETTLNSNFNSIESKMNDRFELQSKELKKTKVLMFILFILTISLAIWFFVK